MKRISSKIRNKGITLIALVVTIVILLILAGITINMFLGNNGILKVARNAGNKQEIEALRERIETIRISYWTKKKVDNSIGLDELWNELVKANIITDKDDEDQVQGPEAGENNTEIYTVITNDGYSIEIIVDSNGNVTIGEITKGTNLGPRIKEFKVVEITSSKIKVKANVIRANGATIQYSYKTSIPENGTYTEISSENVTETGAIVNDLTENVSYDFKVTVILDGIEPIEKRLENVVARNIILVQDIELSKDEAYVGLNRTKTLTATIKPENAENKNLKWTIKDNNIATIDNNGVIIGKTLGTTTIIAESTDNSGVQAKCEVSVLEIIGEESKGQMVTGQKKMYVDENNKEAIIPVGFSVVNDIIGDKNNIERGLVISDKAEDDLNNENVTTKGNQFVWVPVEDYSKFHLIEGYSHQR